MVLDVLVALAVIVVAARLVGALFTRFHQPAVIGEVVAGIMLGPSLLGSVAPGLAAVLVPAETAPFLGVMSQLGVILYMFLIGLELDLTLLRARAATTAAIAVSSIVVPFGLGVILARTLYGSLAPVGVGFMPFALFLGVSMSITAFPVMARILGDKGLQRTPMGIVALTCAAINDAVAWCLLAVVVGGQILNPYNLAKNPGGSSGGTGVAIAASFATVGLGTETGVSVRSPASNNALIGVVPSRGLVSRAGVLPISFTQDRVGVHAKTTADAAVVLSVIRGFDADDLATSESLEQPVADLTALPANSLRGVRVGVLRDMFRKDQEAAAGNAIIEKQLALLTANGAIVIDGLSTGTDLVGLMPSLRVNSYELRSTFDSYLKRRGPARPVQSFAELFNSGKWLKGGVLEARFNDTMKAGELNTNGEYQARLLNQKMMRQQLVALMDRYGVAALVYPMKSLGAPAVGASDDGLRDNNLVSTAGMPAIVVPAGWDAEGLPLALEIMGRPFSDATLLKIANGYELASKNRLSPKTVPPLAGETIQ